MRENPAFEIPPELAFDMGWAGYALAAISGEFEPGGQMRLHGAIAHAAFGLAAAMGGGARGGARNGCGGHGHPDWGGRDREL
ncbi:MULTISPECIES: hypothetical protein [Candidatus Accumulibacter]|uniref:hypothetical protein n=1 Tax=Candidatus Accumulibacter TaxID=327159 RepID=UPI001FE45542|nr:MULTISPECIES: hypothetical protein [Candidatus Accumulibacter]